jgi:hypothetical protein
MLRCPFGWVAATGMGLFAMPLSAVAEPWRIIVTGDSRDATYGVNTAILTEIAARIIAEQPDLVLFTGDLVTGSSDTDVLISQLMSWRNIMQPVYDAGVTVLPVRGNHENTGSVLAWNTVFSGAYAMPDNGPAGEVNVTFALAHRNVLAVGLDQYSGHTHRVSQAWLDEQLAANTRPHVFAFGHEPAFQAYHTDCLDDYPTARNAFWLSLANAGARTYFCGHDHFYDHARIDDQDGEPDNDLHQLIVGAAGAPFHAFDGFYDGSNGGYVPWQQYHVAQYGYVVIVIDGLQVELTWVQRIGSGNYVDMETWGYLVTPEPNTGDVNCDGLVNFGDVNPFIFVLTDLPAWQANYPGCPDANGDINGDGSIGFGDINPFVALLSGRGER